LRTRRICAPVIAGLLLSVLILPQLAVADPAALSLSETSGHCGESIEGTATVDSAGTYHICWNSRTSGNVEDTITPTAAGNYSVEFVVPETAKGTYTVYLTAQNYSQLTASNFTVQPFVESDPEEGPVGTQVTFTGTGFAASQDIRVSFLGAATTGQANTVGSWTLNYTVPATPASGYTFDVEYKDGTTWYKLLPGKNFEVTPEITAPGSGRVGQTIQVSGTGFGSEENNIKVIFRRQGTTADVVAKDGITASDKGSWQADVVVPSVQGGGYVIDASGPSTSAGDVPEVSFTLGARVVVEPTSAQVGDTITVTGDGFASGETGIRVTFDGQVQATVTARINGNWESSFDLPVSAYGSHTISASGGVTSGASTATVSTRAKIETISPNQGSPGDSVSVSGSGFSSNQALTVSVGGVAAPGNWQSSSNGNAVIAFKVPKGSVEGRQTLVVSNAGGASAQDYFTVTEKILPTPQPISPHDDTRLRSGEVTFRWGAATGGSNNITYTLQISNSPDPATYVRSISGLQTSSYTVPQEDPLLEGTYYWWVKAVDDYDNESPWSDSRSFDLSPIPTWVWVVIGVVIFLVLMVVAYRETKFRITE
jgi:hypothetical protein